jgi:hypothetical protein
MSFTTGGDSNMALPVPTDSPFLTLPEGAIRYKFTVTAPKEPVQAFREWLQRNAVPIKRRGRCILVETAVVDAMLDR